MIKKDKVIIISFLIFFLVVVSLGIYLGISLFKNLDNGSSKPIGNFEFTQEFEFKPFESEDEFESYLDSVEKMFGVGTGGMVMDDGFFSRDMVMMEESAPIATSESKVERFSETNVQVQGIDELDIVKTDGNNIFFSQEFDFWFRPMPIIMEDFESDLIIEPSFEEPEPASLRILQAFPPEEMELLKELKHTGKLLLHNNHLLVFTDDGILTYDVTDPSDPQEVWNLEYEERFALVDARLFNDEIFLIINNYAPECPIVPFAVDGIGRTVACRDIYFSPASTDSDSMYNIYKIDAQSGEVKESLSFLGSATNSVIYVSTENIFVTYYLDGNTFELQLKFMLENVDLFSAKLLESLEKVQGYDISLDAKMLELDQLVQKFTSGMSYDDLMQFENERENRLKEFYKQNARDINATGILRIDNESFKVQSSGQIPGYLLNQFSLDEYEGFLRVATTVGESLWSWNMDSNSLNDLYILNDKLEIVGSVFDMGEGERIYSARFIGDKGYLVTFREIDPFYVLDLSDPNNPEIKGELKIPGYSSYLHPLGENTILGVGMEDGSVKLSMFDVSNPNDPQEVSKYILQEYWSDVLNTHKAFLNDPKHEIFFIPGSNGAYIFSYENEKLELIKTVSAYGVKRALFINDYLYIITDEQILVLEQEGWEKVKEIKF